MRTLPSIADSWFLPVWRGIVTASTPSRSHIPAPLVFVVFVSVISFSALSATDVVHAQSGPRRVLVLHTHTTQVPASVIAGESAKKRLTERAQGQIELYTEFLDFERFATDGQEARMTRYLAERYRDREPEVILAIGPSSLRFVVQNRRNLGFEAPIVFCLTSRARLAAIGPDPAVTGIISEFDLTKTLSLAQRLQSDARSIVVVSGASEFDRQWAQIARRQLAPYEQTFDTRYFEGLGHDDLMRALKSLSRDTIVIMLTAYRDGDGRFVIPAEVVTDVARASSAPVYSPYETHLGSGVVGGHTDSFERIGDEAADLALSILAGAAPSTISPRPTSSDRVRVDWRQLQRWGLNENRLPETAEVRFRELSLWERYRWPIVAMIVVVLAQAAALAWMLFERNRRRLAQAALQQRLLEVIHLNRTATASALSASVAHELNQPLAAIQSYAEAAEIYLKSTPPNLDRVEEILGNIREDDKRAADIISHFRGLLKRSDAFELRELDVNEVIRTTRRILDPEALKRGVTLSTHQTETSLSVRADQVHLQQVILNLAVNGLDAMQNCPAGTGRMSIQTAVVGEAEVEVSIADTGTGIPADKLNAIFDTFYTTKRLGTGLGLSIARTIVETYGGRIWAENRPGGGAAFRFTLPRSRGISA